jgi:hypothetical protein
MNENRAKAQAKLQEMKQNLVRSSAGPLSAAQQSTEASRKPAPMSKSSQKWEQQFSCSKEDVNRRKFRSSKFTGKVTRGLM